jgi:hypothetical protein
VPGMKRFLRGVLLTTMLVLGMTTGELANRWIDGLCFDVVKGQASYE